MNITHIQTAAHDVIERRAVSLSECRTSGLSSVCLSQASIQNKAIHYTILRNGNIAKGPFS